MLLVRGAAARGRRKRSAQHAHRGWRVALSAQCAMPARCHETHRDPPPSLLSPRVPHPLTPPPRSALSVVANFEQPRSHGGYTTVPRTVVARFEQLRSHGGNALHAPWLPASSSSAATSSCDSRSWPHSSGGGGSTRSHSPRAKATLRKPRRKLTCAHRQARVGVERRSTRGRTMRACLDGVIRLSRGIFMAVTRRLPRPGHPSSRRGRARRPRACRACPPARPPPAHRNVTVI